MTLLRIHETPICVYNPHTCVYTDLCRVHHTLSYVICMECACITIWNTFYALLYPFFEHHHTSRLNACSPHSQCVWALAGTNQHMDRLVNACIIVVNRGIKLFIVHCIGVFSILMRRRARRTERRHSGVEIRLIRFRIRFRFRSLLPLAL